LLNRTIKLEFVVIRLIDNTSDIIYCKKMDNIIGSKKKKIKMRI